MKKIIERKPNTAAHLEHSNLHPLLQRIYSNRNITSLTELEYNLEHLLPFVNLLGIKEAVNCLWEALHKQQNILIIGDYDADGATSTALAIRALKACGAQNISYLVPNRFDYGYGLTPEIVTVAATKNPNLIITVDNGISSYAGVAKAKQLGFKVLITDHHLSGDELPKADAIVNPNQANDQFGSKHLAGVGVIFYVMLAFRRFLREQNWFAKTNLPEPNMAKFLDLVALGTVADIVTLDHNNRILVQQGLQKIRADKCCPGIKSLIKIANRNYKTITANDLGYALAPRLNAAGRLDDMSIGIECLLTDDPHKSYELANQLNLLNEERRIIEIDMHQQATRALTNIKLAKEPPPALCLFDENWHQGVIGILAARIKDQFHRPVIAFAKVDDKEMKGSARSIPGLHIRDILDSIATKNLGLINKFGGHAMAAGLSLEIAKYQEFCTAFTNEVGQHLNSMNLREQLYVDGELTKSELNLEVAELLNNGGPWGQDFPEPMFVGKFNIMEQRLVGQKHLKLTLNLPQDEQLINAIAFNVDTTIWPNYRCNEIHVAYRPDVNEYQGRRSLQLIIEHII